MSSIFKNGGIYYLKVTVNYKSKIRSLQTKDLRIAKQRAKHVENELYEFLKNPNKSKFLPFNELCNLFLKADHSWTPRTRETYEWVINSFKPDKPLPKNPATKDTFKRRVNVIINWGIENNFTTNVNKFKLGKMIARNRVFTDAEMMIILNDTEPEEFNRLVRIAYYTGARRGELLTLDPVNVFEMNNVWCINVTGKTGTRVVRLNKQAVKVLSTQGEPFSYTLNYITTHFKKNLRKMKIKNGRFHDLRRTFGFNLIRRGMPIYQVSKLLGHSNFSTTESHYAPLLVTDVAEFTL